MTTFAHVYASLNTQQRKAVDMTDGPLLVLAGPGTGKTQLLGARVANILEVQDVAAHNILCMTFTENGARNMRERLVSFIGSDAYDVHISTYHGFGGELIRRFPEYFGQTKAEQPVDQLGQRQIVEDILAKLPYSDPLKSAQYFVNDIVSTVGELKRALISPADAELIAKENLDSIKQAAKHMPELQKMPSKAIALDVFNEILVSLETAAPKTSALPQFGSIVALAYAELQQALTAAVDNPKVTPPLTAWKNKWLVKNSHNHLVLSGERESLKLLSMARILAKYESGLEERGWYDFNDMITRSIVALEEHDDLRFTLQEQYQYILLDEFQDTNAAQLKLVELLTNNPVNEGRPNVMAVGDDDQAIFAFQGAQYSNLKQFYDLFRDTQVINLVDNYRSHQDILHVSHAIAEQIEERLHHSITAIEKQLVAAAPATKVDNPAIERHEFVTAVAETDWVAEQIQKLISQHQVEPSEIAVLAPNHSILQSMVGPLNSRNIPVSYSKREDILQAPLIQQVLAVARLAEALARHDEVMANSLWPEVLSAEWWGLPIETTWRLSWLVQKSNKDLTWTEAALSLDDTRHIAEFMMRLAARSLHEPAEFILDYIAGIEPLKHVETGEDYNSPLKRALLSTERLADDPAGVYEALSQLTVLRDKLRDHQTAQAQTLMLADLVNFIDTYQAAGEPMTFTSPYHQAANSVQLMTVFGAKGLEFKRVFVVHAIDSVWGPSARGRVNKVSLPANLSPIRHAGSTEDERLRAFFVAVTRAKQGLYITSHTHTYSGKQTSRLKYLDERETEDGSIHTHTLPAKHRKLTTHQRTESKSEVTEQLMQNWRSLHIQAFEDTRLHDLLSERLDRYQLGPTHLNSFVDLEFGGPEHFLFNTLLRFPKAPSISGQFGNAVHESLEWLQLETNRQGIRPKLNQLHQVLRSKLDAKAIEANQVEHLFERGKAALSAFYKQCADELTRAGNKPEHRFANEGVVVGDAHLTGNIDLLVIDTDAKTIRVVDYKTGSSYDRWRDNLKLHKYKQQLYCYKLLVELSNSYRDYTVTSGELIFVEPDDDGVIHRLQLDFTNEDMETIKLLFNKVWLLVKHYRLPDVSEYTQNYAGTKQFEADLLAGKFD